MSSFIVKINEDTNGNSSNKIGRWNHMKPHTKSCQNHTKRFWSRIGKFRLPYASMFSGKEPASDLRSVNLRLRGWLCFCLLGNFCLRCFRRFWLWLLRLLVRLQQFLRDVSIWEVLLNPQWPQVSNHPKSLPGQDSSEIDNNQCKAHKLQTSRMVAHGGFCPVSRLLIQV